MAAELIKRVIVDNEDPSQVKKDATRLMKEFQKIEYCFR